MGKQLPIAMTEEDEVAFLSFLQGRAGIRIFRPSASSNDALEVTSFDPRSANVSWSYLIWNTAFHWEPQIAKTEDGKRFYICNTLAAPCIHYDRHNFHGNGYEDGYGRIYWSKFWGAPDGVTYDVAEFSKWFDKIVRWLKKNGHQHPTSPYKVMYQKDAWARFGPSS